MNFVDVYSNFLITEKLESTWVKSSTEVILVYFMMEEVSCELTFFWTILKIPWYQKRKENAEPISNYLHSVLVDFNV